MAVRCAKRQHANAASGRRSRGSGIGSDVQYPKETIRISSIPPKTQSAWTLDDLLARTAVLIPALDEAESIGPLLCALPSSRLGAVLVVDNGSSDGTGDIARGLGARVVTQLRRGYGAACLAGIEWLERQSPKLEWLVFLDADDREGAGRLPLLLKPLGDGADLVLAQRRGRGGRPLRSRWGGAAILLLAALLFGRRFRDMGPFRGIRMSRLAELQLDDATWGWTLQMQLRAHARGLNIVEIEVSHQGRRLGASKISGRLGVAIRVGARMLFTLLRERLAKGPEAPRSELPDPPIRPRAPDDRS